MKKTLLLLTILLLGNKISFSQGCGTTANYTISPSTTVCLGTPVTFANTSVTVDSVITAGGPGKSRDLMIDYMRITGTSGAGAFSVNWEYNIVNMTRPGDNSYGITGAGAANVTAVNSAPSAGYDIVTTQGYNSKNYLELDRSTNSWPGSRFAASTLYVEYTVTANGSDLTISGLDITAVQRNSSGGFTMQMEASLNGAAFAPISPYRYTVVGSTAPAAYSFSPSSAITVPAGQTIKFRMYTWGGSTDATKTAAAMTYAWNFGDNSTSTATNPPAHTYAATGTYNVKLVASTANCKDSITKQVTVIGSLSADAGPDQTDASMCGSNSTILAAVQPALGTGTWSGGAGGTIGNTANNTSSFSGTAGTSYTLTWTVTNAGCNAATDNVTITFQNTPSTAAAGSDQIASLCGQTSATLGATAPTVGTGAWSIISGAGGSITTPASRTSTFTGTAGTAYVLRWTVSNAPCTASSDDVTIEFPRNPSTPVAGADIIGNTTCGQTTIALAATSPAVGTGAWTIQSGTGGSVAVPASNTSNFTGVAGNTYVLRWTVSNAPCASAFDDVTVKFNEQPSVSDAGADQPNVCSESTNLNAVAPTKGTGQWSLISGTGTITNNTLRNTSVTGLGVGNNVFRWTVSNSPCNASTNDVTITRNVCTIIADFTTTVTSQCINNPTFVFRDTSVGATTYSWNFGAGATPATAATVGPHSVTYSSSGYKTVSLTITGPGGTDTRVKTDYISVNDIPTTSNAGPSQSGTNCGLTATSLAATPATVGTGTWTIESGAGGSLSNQNDPTSSFTGVAGSAYLLRWTVANAPCSSSTDTMTVSFPQIPTPVDAGPDQTNAAMCGLTSTTLAATAPTIGTGKWTIQSGAGGTLGDDTSPTSTFSGTAGTSYVLRWTVSNSPCASVFDNVTITFQRNPTTSNAGADQNGSGMCGLTSTTLAAVAPTVGTGAWTIQSGAGGTVTTPASATSNFSGTAGTTYILRWTVTNAPCPSSSDNVTVRFQRNPSTANAGADQMGLALCGQTATNLAATAPTVGTGAWSIISGTGGTIVTPSSRTSAFNGTAGTTYELKWTVSNSPCAASSDTVRVKFSRNPSASNAGADQTGSAICGLTTINLTANTPTIGTGAWSIKSGIGGTISATANPLSGFSGVAGNTYVLNWTVTNSPCNASVDSVKVTFQRNPTTSVAGADQTSSAICGLTSTTLAGNTPTIGTGSWSVLSGAGGTITTPNSPTSNFSGTAGATYELAWTVSNAPCSAAVDTVVVKFQQNPTVADAGSDQDGSAVCGSTKISLEGNTPTVGTGAWSIKSGAGGSIETVNDPASGFSGVPGTTYELYWTVTNAPCAASKDSVMIKFNQNATGADAGADQTGSSVCGLTKVQLAGNTPAIGTGTWSIKSGAGGLIADPANPASEFTGVAGITYELFWTVNNPPCAVKKDSVTITFQQNPSTANAGSDQTGAATCGRTSVTVKGNRPSVGVGSWSIKSGTGGSFAVPTDSSTSFTGTPGKTYELYWTVSNAPCAAAKDSITVTFQQNPSSADAGSDQLNNAMCGKTTTVLEATAPTIGTGLWSIQSGTGGVLGTPADPNSSFQGTAGTTYVLRWTVTNSPCADSSKDITVLFPQNPANADAGADQVGASLCGQTFTTLAAVQPAVGTGSWRISSGTGGVLTNKNLFNSAFSGIAGNTYSLTWTVTNAPCAADSASINVRFSNNPTVANAGADQNGGGLCGQNTTILGANTAAVGKGVWSIISGTGGVIVDTTKNNSVFTGIPGNAYILRWTISNAPCAASSKDVNILFPKNADTSSAGADQTGLSMCGLTSTTLAAGAPVNGTGSWSIVSGTGGVIADTLSNVSAFSGVSGNNYTLKWTVRNAPCASASRTVQVAFVKAASFKFSPPDTSICENDQIILHAQSGFTNYEWQDGSKYPTLLITKQGVFSVKATDPNGCRVTASINVDACSYDSIYNVFTPNGDGKNEYFIIRGLVPNSEVEIYNRWGTKVYANANYDNTWDGGGSSDGIYYYVYRKRNQKTYTGYVEIIR